MNKKIIVYLACLMGVSVGFGANSGSSDDPSGQSWTKTIEEDGVKVVVKEVQVNLDYKKLYEKIKSNKDDEINALKDRLSKCEEINKLAIDEYEKIEKVLGLRNWTGNSVERLTERLHKQARSIAPSKETLKEYAYIFRNFPVNPSELPENRQFYLWQLLGGGEIQEGMSIVRLEELLGSPESKKSMENEETNLTYRLLQDRIAKFQFKQGKLDKVLYGASEGRELSEYNLGKF